MQGSAVRSGVHKPVYHTTLCSHHFAPAIAYLLLQNEQVSKAVDYVVEPVLNAFEQGERFIKNRLK